MNSNEILEREFLDIRSKILMLAASLDRIGRADGDAGDSEKMALIRKGIDTLSSDENDRAEQVQLLFSKDYQKNWLDEFRLAPRF